MSHFERRWYQWHLRSLFALLVLVTIFVLLAVPGTVTMRTGELPAKTTSRVVYYGWPFIHRVEFRAGEPTSEVRSLSPEETLDDEVARLTLNSSRSLVPATHASSTERYWSNSAHWKYAQSDHIGVYFWPALFVNIAIATAVCLLVPMWMERRRRKREVRGRIGLLDMLARIAIGIAVVGLPLYHVIRWQSDVNTLRHIAGDTPSEDTLPLAAPSLSQRRIVSVHRLTDYQMPRWHLHKLLDRLGTRQLSSVTLYGTTASISPTPDPVDVATTLDTLPAVNRIDVKNLNTELAKTLESLGAKRVTELSIDGGDDPTPLTFLRRFTNLRKLTLEDVEFTSEIFGELTCEHLEEIELDFFQADEAVCEWLSKQPQLKIVYLRSPYPVDEVRQRIPNVHVTVIPAPRDEASVEQLSPTVP